ncbi:forkhead box protein n4-like [Plakobranchus ocellatus]|uniref:Forkhead box protein n4-like n=1 Tax=Plakobranchus ocellatus TaxID=259542 RepID=A0AAV4BBZ4_9GAST|nr:forkhead box protein n4-like [Plakobranchus ocellatus]
MESYPERTVDPLLFLNTDKSDLDAFLLNTSADMAQLEELQANVVDAKLENSLDIDSLERNGHLGDMNWLHNSSLTALTHLDNHNEDTSDGSNLISVDPQSVLPMQMSAEEETDTKPRNFHSPDFANSAAMRLHANCSSLGDSPENLPQSVSQLQQHHQVQGIQSPKPINLIRQEHETIRILSVASQGSPASSPIKAQNFLITSTRDSPHKQQTFVLSSATGGALPAGLSFTTNTNRVSTAGPHFVISSPQKLHAISTDKSGRVLLKSGNNLLSPSQASPVLLGRLQTGIQPQLYQQLVSNSNNMATATTVQGIGAHQEHHHQLLQQHQLPAAAAADSNTVSSTTGCEDKVYPKPSFSYSCLIALALKNSKNGSLPVSEIYSFMCENFPYFKTAPDGWKNSVRHNLSLNKCFAKVDNPKLSQGAKKGCLWALNPAKVTKMEDEISKWGKKDPAGLLCSMAYPENLEAIEKGQAGLHYGKRIASESKFTTSHQGEATPTKTVSYSTPSSSAPSPAVKQEVYTPTHPSQHHQQQQQAAYRLEKLHPNIRVEKVEPKTPTKAEMSQVVSSMEVSSPVQRHEVSSPAVKPQNLQSIRLDPNLDLSHLEFPVSLNSDALADIVLQSSMWDEDLENNIDIDLICDSPTPHVGAHSTTHSPMTVRPPSNSTSTIPLGSSYSSTGHLSPSIQPLYSHMLNSPVQNMNPSPASVRSNLFGVSSPLKPLFA